VATPVYTEQEDDTEEVGMPIEEEDVALVAKGEDEETPTTRIDKEDDAVQCELDEDSMADSNNGTAKPRLESDEARDHAQHNPTIAKEGNDVTEPDAGDEVVDVVEKRTSAVDDMVFPVNTLCRENVDDWFGSNAEDEVVRKVVAEENIDEKGNNEPSRADDSIVVGASLLYQEEDDWLGSDAEDEVVRKQVTDENEAEIRHSGTIELANDVDNLVIDALFTSIQKARDAIVGQWRECTWDKNILDIKDPATSVEVIGLSTHTFV
jgi:hypothetical protein